MTTAADDPKSQAKRRFSSLGGSLGGTDLAPVAVVQDSVPATYTVDPRGIPLSETVRMAVDGCKAAQGQSGNIAYAAASTSTFLLRELFLSSEGADLEQSFAQTEGFAIVICGSEHGNFEHYDFTGHQRGWEVLTDGYDRGPIVLPNFIDFCSNLGADAAEVAAAPKLEPPGHERTSTRRSRWTEVPSRSRREKSAPPAGKRKARANGA